MKKNNGKNPSITVDAIVRYNKGIVLIERKNPPFGWALPGGFIEYGESAEQTVAREVKEEIGLRLNAKSLSQFQVYSNPKRDPRGHIITIVFTAEGKGKLAAGDDSKNAKVFTEETLPKRIAFDHRKILGDYFKRKH